MSTFENHCLAGQLTFGDPFEVSGVVGRAEAEEYATLAKMLPNLLSEFDLRSLLKIASQVTTSQMAQARDSPEKWLKPTPASGLDWLACSHRDDIDAT